MLDKKFYKQFRVKSADSFNLFKLYDLLEEEKIDYFLEEDDLTISIPYYNFLRFDTTTDSAVRFLEKIEKIKAEYYCQSSIIEIPKTALYEFNKFDRNNYLLIKINRDNRVFIKVRKIDNDGHEHFKLSGFGNYIEITKVDKLYNLTHSDIYTLSSYLILGLFISNPKLEEFIYNNYKISQII